MHRHSTNSGATGEDVNTCLLPSKLTSLKQDKWKKKVLTTGGWTRTCWTDILAVSGWRRMSSKGSKIRAISPRWMACVNQVRLSPRQGSEGESKASKPDDHGRERRAIAKLQISFFILLSCQLPMLFLPISARARLSTVIEPARAGIDGWACDESDDETKYLTAFYASKHRDTSVLRNHRKFKENSGQWRKFRT